MVRKYFLVAGLAICGLGFSNCVTKTGPDPVANYRYKNTTQFDIEITSKNSEMEIITPSGKVTPQDSLTIIGNNNFLGRLDFRQDTSAIVKVVFKSVPEKCLEFSGTIIDSAFDLRSRAAYQMTDFVGFVYTFENEQYEKAGTCH